MTPDLLLQFTTAVAAPITKKVAWTDEIPVDHPLRSLELYVRYWPVAVAAELNSILNDLTIDRVEAIRKTYWYTIASTICDQKGEPAFAAMWPQICDAYASAVENGTGLASKLPSLDENGNKVYPPINYYEVGAKLKEMFDENPQGATVMGVLYNAAMDYNGWKFSAVGKPSETTQPSQQSND